MSASGLPFDDIRTLCTMLPPPDSEAMEMVRSRNTMLAKPPGGLGRLEDIAVWLAGWQGNGRPAVTRPVVVVFAGNHGVTKHGVSACSQNLTAEAIANLSAGGGAVNQVCATFDIGLKVFELALPVPTADITIAAAMEEKDCTATMAFGMEALAGGTDLIGLGDIGVGGTTAAAAVLHALFGGAAADWISTGYGADDQTQAHKRAAVEAAVAHHRSELRDPLEVLRRLGGREIAAMTGAILAARLQRIPVVLDGIVAAAAAAVLHALDKDAIAHCLAGHVTDAAHERALARLGLQPVLNLGLAMGEGTGAALAMGTIRAAIACHVDMATATEAGVSGKLN
ncbi:MAG: nicotinate-nucleotide--dimethylbenzimidazole phosphoribosyltransferase [Proteobacteria bacterium]|nr:nicotinate-nucleotide--dimethylbenzimidazole phosphoribosyltransferase [Pseudomonadota bacterium]